MWWCCGKKNKEALGCIISKHFAKEEDEDFEEEEKDQ